MASRDTVERTDDRWLIMVVLVFVVTVGGLLLVREVYRATGPHPAISTFVRRTRYYANALLRQGRLKRPLR